MSGVHTSTVSARLTDLGFVDSLVNQGFVNPCPSTISLMIWRGVSISFRHCSISHSSDQLRRLAKVLNWLIVMIGTESISWCKARVSGGNMGGMTGLTSSLKVGGTCPSGSRGVSKEGNRRRSM
jgi:hypothetical protein